MSERATGIETQRHRKMTIKLSWDYSTLKNKARIGWNVLRVRILLLVLDLNLSARKLLGAKKTNQKWRGDMKKIFGLIFAFLLLPILMLLALIGVLFGVVSWIAGIAFDAIADRVFIVAGIPYPRSKRQAR